MSKPDAQKKATLINAVVIDDSPDGLLPRDKNEGLWRNWESQNTKVGSKYTLNNVRLSITSQTSTTNDQVRALMDDFLSDYVCPEVVIMQTDESTLVIKDLMQTIASDFDCFMNRKEHETDVKTDEGDPENEVDDDILDLLTEQDDDDKNEGKSVQDTMSMSDSEVPTTETSPTGKKEKEEKKKKRRYKTLAEMGHDQTTRSSDTTERAASEVLKRIIGGGEKDK